VDALDEAGSGEVGGCHDHDGKGVEYAVGQVAVSEHAYGDHEADGEGEVQ